MRVAVEAVGNRCGGGLCVLLRTVAALSRDPRIARLDVFCSPRAQLAEPLPELGNVRWHEGPDHVALRVGWYERGFAGACRRAEADVALCLNAMGRAQIPTVSVVQQALALAPQRKAVSLAHAARLRVIRSLLLSGCRASRAVVVQTHWMGEAVHEQLRVQPRVLPLGLIAHQGGLANRPALVVAMGGSLPYKNGPVVKRALQRVRSADCTLIGEPPRPFAEVEAALQRARVTLVGSRIESFGLPLVEAFAFDSAVVAADRPYARDVCDNAALYFEASNPVAAACRVEELLHDDDLRADFVARGRRQLQRLWAKRPYERLVDLLEEHA